MQARPKIHRLLHEAVVPRARAHLPTLDDALSTSLQRARTEFDWPERHGDSRGFEFHGDRLIESSATRAGDEYTRVELTTGGTLRVWESIDVGGLRADDIARSISNFLAVGWAVCRGAFERAPEEYRWRLLDCPDGTVLDCPTGWLDEAHPQRATLPPGDVVLRASHPAPKMMGQPDLLAAVKLSVRELLYPFELRGGTASAPRFARVSVPEQSALEIVERSRAVIS